MTKLNNEKAVSDKVIEYIASQVREGKLSHGDKLPSQTVLSEDLGISRASVREALQKLELAGIVRIIQGKGSYITNNPSLEGIKNVISLFISLGTTSDKNNIVTLLEARRFVEAGTARLAAKHSDEVSVDKIESALEEMSTAYEEDDFKCFQEKDLEFHMAISKASGNVVLERIIETIRDLIVEQLEFVLKLSGRMAYTQKEHQKIYEAIKGGDIENAGAFMEEHLGEVIRSIKES